MVNFNRPKSTPTLKEAEARIHQLYQSIGHLIADTGRELDEVHGFTIQRALMSTASAVLSSGIRALFLSIGGNPLALKTEHIGDCIKLVVERLKKEV